MRGERREPADVLATVTRVTHFDTIKSNRDERLESRPQSACAGMRPHRDSPRLVGELDCGANIETLLLDECRPPCSEEPIERFTPVAHSARADQSGCDVRSANRSAARLLQHRLETDVSAKRAETIHNASGAYATRVTKLLQLCFEPFDSLNVEREDMDLLITLMRTQLHSRDEPKVRWWAGVTRFYESGERVVVGEGNRAETRSHRGGGNIRRRAGSVGSGRMRV